MPPEAEEQAQEQVETQNQQQQGEDPFAFLNDDLSVITEQKIDEKVTKDDHQEEQHKEEEDDKLIDRQFGDLDKEIKEIQEQVKSEEEQQEDKDEEVQTDDSQGKKKHRDEAAAKLREAYEATKTEKEGLASEKATLEQELKDLKGKVEEYEQRIKKEFSDRLKVNPDQDPEVIKQRDRYIQFENSVRRVFPKFTSNSIRNIIQRWSQMDPNKEGYEGELEQLQSEISSVDPRLNGREVDFLRQLGEGESIIKNLEVAYTNAQNNVDQTRLRIQSKTFESELSEWNKIKESIFDVPERFRDNKEHWMNIVDAFRETESFQKVNNEIIKHMDDVFSPIRPVPRDQFKTDEEYFEHQKRAAESKRMKLANVPKMYAYALAMAPIIQKLFQDVQKYKDVVAEKKVKFKAPDTSTDKTVNIPELGITYDPETKELRVPDENDMTRQIMGLK